MEKIINDTFKVNVHRERHEVDLYVEGELVCTLSFAEVSRLDGICCPEVIPAGPSGCPPKE
jgi:hypothetical protein